MIVVGGASLRASGGSDVRALVVVIDNGGGTGGRLRKVLHTERRRATAIEFGFELGVLLLEFGEKAAHRDFDDARKREMWTNR